MIKWNCVKKLRIMWIQHVYVKIKTNTNYDSILQLNKINIKSHLCISIFTVSRIY